MKTMLLLVISFFATKSYSGVGGTSGGNHLQVFETAQSQLTRVWDCNGGESGTDCRWIIFKLRPPSLIEPASCTVITGENAETPCLSYSPQIPFFLQHLQTYLRQQGYHPADDQIAP